MKHVIVGQDAESVAAPDKSEKSKVKHQVNPFWETLQMDRHTRRAKLKGENGPKALVSLGTGEREGVAEVSRVYEVDGDQFIKVFTRYLTVFFDISKNGQKLFEFALNEASRNKNKDCLFLNPKDADRYHKSMGRSGYSQASFYRATDELCEAQIFARSDVVGKFFINPAIFWNGDRVDFVTQLRKSPQYFSPGETDPTGENGEMEKPHESDWKGFGFPDPHFSDPT